MDTKSLGAIPSPFDYRDGYAAASIVAPSSAPFALPGSKETDLGTILDQRQIPACVAHSVALILRLYWFRKTGEWIDFSPRFLDILSAQSWIPLDGGRMPRTVLRVAANKGCATTATLPNDTTLSIAEYRNPSVISAEAYAEALKYRIPGYISIPLTQDASRVAIDLYGAISGTYLIGRELYTALDGTPTDQDAYIDPLRTPKQVIGGHQMTPCGWQALNTIQNSWGDDWANKGRASYDFDAWLPYTSEQWAIAEVPADVADFLKALPSPSAFHFTWGQNLAQGQQGDDVKWLQVALMILGHLGPVAPAELGMYGPRTAVAVAKFQASRGINPVPGSVGPLTRGALNKQFSI